jgi:hypothetical protein
MEVFFITNASFSAGLVTPFVNQINSYANYNIIKAGFLTLEPTLEKHGEFTVTEYQWFPEAFPM